MKKVLLLSLLFFISIHAQDYVRLYQEFIPLQRIKSSKSLISTFNKNIDALAKINPDLIYFYIKYMNLMIGENIANPDSNFKNILDIYSNNYRYQINEFLSEQLDLLEKKECSYRVKKEIKNIFVSRLNSRIKTLQKKPEADINNNLQDYFSYLYLSKKNDIEYNPEIKYKNLCLESANKLRSNIYQYIKELKTNKSDPNFNFIDDLFNHTYLFMNSYKNKYYSDNTTNILDLFEIFFKKYFKIWNQIEVNYSFDIIPNKYEFTYTIYDPVALDTDVKIDYNLNTFYNLGIAYQKRISEDYGSFAFIKIQAGVSYLTQQIKNREIEGNIAALQGIGRFGGPYSFKQNLKKYYSFGVQISTPFIYLSRPLRIEGSINYTFQTISYLIEFTRDKYSLINPNQYPQYVVPIKESDEFEKNNHQFTPIFAIVYSLSEYIDIRSDFPILSLSSNSEFKSLIRWRISLAFKLRI